MNSFESCRRAAEMSRLGAEEAADTIVTAQLPNRTELGMDASGKQFHFHLYNSARRQGVDVFDGNSGEALCQVPPEGTIRMATEIRRKPRWTGSGSRHV
jgi:uncharacterized FlaG/YvyC family protein